MLIELTQGNGQGIDVNTDHIVKVTTSDDGSHVRLRGHEYPMRVTESRDQIRALCNSTEAPLPRGPNGYAGRGWTIIRSDRTPDINDMEEPVGAITCAGRVPATELIERGWERAMNLGGPVNELRFLVLLSDPIWAALP